MFVHLHPMYGNIGRQPYRFLEVPQQQLHPFLQQAVYDQLEPEGKIKDFKEGGAVVKFEVFNGHSDRTKVLTYLQQFDTTYMGGLYTEASKIRKASSFLKGNAL